MIYVCSFGQQGYYNRIARSIVKKINRKYPHSKGLVYNQFSLPEEIRFYAENYPRGFGYWRWKPFVIFSTIEKMSHGDILLYVDGRTNFKAKKIGFLDDFVLNDKWDIAVYQSVNFETKYTTKKIIEFLNVSPSELNTGQYLATIIAFRKSDKTIDFITEWNALLKNFPELFRDDHNFDLNFPDFIENRHDQSALSSLLKTKELSIYVIDDHKELDKLLPQYWTHKGYAAPFHNSLKTLLPRNYFDFVLKTYLSVKASFNGRKRASNNKKNL